MNQQDWIDIGNWAYYHVNASLQRGTAYSGGGHAYTIILGNREFRLVQRAYHNAQGSHWVWSLDFCDMSAQGGTHGNIFDNGTTEEVLCWARQMAGRPEPKSTLRISTPENYGDW